MRGWSLTVRIRSVALVEPSTVSLDATFALLTFVDVEQAILSSSAERAMSELHGVRTVRLVPGAERDALDVTVTYDGVTVPASSLPHAVRTVSSLDALFRLLSFLASAAACRCVAPHRYSVVEAALPITDSTFVHQHIAAAVEQRPFLHMEQKRLYVRVLHWRAHECAVLVPEAGRCRACEQLHERVRKWQRRGSVSDAMVAAARQHAVQQSTDERAAHEAALLKASLQQRSVELDQLLEQLGCADLPPPDPHDADVRGSAEQHGVPEEECVLLLVGALRAGLLSTPQLAVLRDSLRAQLLRAAGHARQVRWSAATVAALLRFTKQHGVSALLSLEQMGFAVPTSRTLLE